MVYWCLQHKVRLSVASLGWVTPWAATEGVTPLFFSWKKLTTFFFSFLLIAVTITIAFYCFLFGVTPSRVSPHTFFTCLTFRPRFSTILCKFAHKVFFTSGVTPWRVSPGAVPLPPMTPLVRLWQLSPPSFQTKFIIVDVWPTQIRCQ